MFCSKCGSELPDGVKFCRKCGAKLINDDIEQRVVASTPAEPEQQIQQQSQTVILSMSTKKKSGKLLIGLGVAVIVAIVAIIIALKGNGKVDYVATVGAHTPFAASQGLPYTYGEVLNKYIVSPKWEVRESGDAHYVDISGTLKGMDNKLIITIKATSDPDDSDIVLMSPESVTLNGEKSPTQNDAVEFLFVMFSAYNEGYEDLSVLMSSIEMSGPLESDILSGNNTDDSSYKVFAEALWNLITYNTLPDGEIANDLDGMIDGMWDKFAICDINQDGTAELLIKIGSGSEAAQGQYIYQVNSNHSGLELLYSFFTDAVYYDTGFIREEWSHNQGLSDNFWPYSILQWEPGGCREIAGADAWEKMAWETDFSGNAFPDNVDTDGNGIVYFIGGEDGIDYDNPVDDAEYNAFVKNFFSAGNEIYVPWRDITEENVETATGYTMTASSEPSAGYGDSSVNMSSGFSESLA